jgi:hypothetical protein
MIKHRYVRHVEGVGYEEDRDAKQVVSAHDYFGPLVSPNPAGGASYYDERVRFRKAAGAFGQNIYITDSHSPIREAGITATPSFLL